MRRLIFGVLFLPLFIVLMLVVIGFEEIVLGHQVETPDAYFSINASLLPSCVTAYLLLRRPGGELTFHWLFAGGLLLVGVAAFELNLEMAVSKWASFMGVEEFVIGGSLSRLFLLVVTLVAGLGLIAAAVWQDRVRAWPARDAVRHRASPRVTHRWAIASAAVVLVIGFVVFLVINSAPAQAARAERVRAAVERDERDIEAQRERVEEWRRSRRLAQQIAPFDELSAQQFPKAEADNRLELLFQRINSLIAGGAKWQGRRHLDADALARIREKLQSAPGLAVEVGGVFGDQESLALAADLRLVFTGDVFKVRPLAEYRLPEDAARGVSIYSKHELNEVLADAVAQIFREIGQPVNQWISEEIAGATIPDTPAPELKIIVGRVAEAER